MSQEKYNQRTEQLMLAGLRASALKQCVDQCFGFGRFFFAPRLELHVVEAPVIAGLLEQLGVPADFFDVPLVHHHDLVG
jgi:hypothetical protein